VPISLIDVITSLVKSLGFEVQKEVIASEGLGYTPDGSRPALKAVEQWQQSPRFKPTLDSFLVHGIPRRQRSSLDAAKIVGRER
jgi:hypothetical protein